MSLEKYAVVENCLFEVVNFYDKSGGAISASDIGTCVLKNLLFHSCSANHGGAAAINNSIVILYYACFSNCSARETNENGGNSVYTFNCSLSVDFMSSFKCAPDTTQCGDAVFQLRSTNVHATHTNFSSCNGLVGECSFGSIDTSASHVSYMNVIDCYEFSMYNLPGSTLEYSNFLNNRPYSYYINGLHGKARIYNSFFFGNDIREDGRLPEYKANIEYYNCYGDISRTGVFNSQVKTYYQTKIIYQSCQKRACLSYRFQRAGINCLVMTIELINYYYSLQLFSKSGDVESVFLECAFHNIIKRN